MSLNFSADRPLAVIAAMSDRLAGWGAGTLARRPGSPRVVRLSHVSRPRRPITPPCRPEQGVRAVVESALVTVLTGQVDGLGDALTDDVEGWSPTVRFGSLREAEELLSDVTASLPISEFDLDGLWWNEPFAFAEWRVKAIMSVPLLIGDDLMVSGSGQPIHIAGATFAEFRNGRIARINTYFDDASLIEQVLGMQ